MRQEALALADALKKKEGADAPAAAEGDRAKAAEGGEAAALADDALIRSKGFIWLSNSHPQMFYWALAGKHFELKQYATWWDNVPRDEWPEEAKEVATIMRDFEGEYGDHRQELVFIGVRMDKAAIVALLDECLLSDDEMRSYKQHLDRLEAEGARRARGGRAAGRGGARRAATGGTRWRRRGAIRVWGQAEEGAAVRAGFAAWPTVAVLGWGGSPHVGD